MRTKLHLIFLFFSSFLFAQQEKINIQWNDEKQIETAHGTINVPGFDDAHFLYNDSPQSINYVSQWNIQSLGQTFDLQNIIFQNVAASKLKNIDLSLIPDELQYTITTTKARNASKAILILNPLIKDGDTYKRVTSFEIEDKGITANELHNFSLGLTNSVLATGDWFRFYVEKTGIHKIDREFLSDLGIDVENIDPAKIKIYGDGGRMLPLLNSDNEYFDPPQNAIKVVGGADGSFDAGDYILFYGISTTGYNEESRTHINAYADRAYYYITVDGENGVRVQDAIEPTGTPNIVIESFEDYKFYEVDEYNIAKMGRRWFGDRFDVQSQRSYDFHFENLITSEPVEVKVAAAASSEVPTYMQVSVNDQQIGNLSFSSISASILGRADQLAASIDVDSETIEVELNYNNNGNPSSQAFLDFISVAAERLLKVEEEQLIFQFEDAPQFSGIGKYIIQNASEVPEVWNITNFTAISSYSNTGIEEIFSFQTNLGEAQKFVALLPSDYYEPKMEAETVVENQNLKGIFYNSEGEFEDIDYLLFTSEELLPQAQRLAQHRRDFDELNVKVIDVEDVYDEFSTGKQDIAAIRNFIKYVYDNASSPAEKLQYIGFLGDASVDYKDRLENNNNIVPTYFAYQSFSLRTSHVTDDFFGFMDPDEGDLGYSDLLDIAVGRILADTPQNAEQVIDKIIAYDSKEAYGRWRNNIAMISDDAIDAYEFENLMIFTNELANNIIANKPALNVHKVFADAFQQESSAGGDRYPEVNETINDIVEVGALVINYFGHGGESGLAHERILTQTDILNWTNSIRLPVFVTVTCEFTKFDNPLHISAGELVLTHPGGGAAGMITTTREILISDGKTFNSALLPFLLNYNGGGDDSVAESLRKTKNAVSIGGERIVMYFGDPAMKLAIPEPKVVLTAINDVPIESATDTLKALSHVKISGQVVTAQGDLLQDYNGLLSATIFDKPIERHSLNNDNVNINGAPAILDFETLGEIVYRGQASVEDGNFDFEFVVPRDISMPVGEGKISFYAQENDEFLDQKGYNNNIKIGGLNEDAPEDNMGPEIILYMNDENFVPGGITNASPFILAKLSDENGINTASGIGHDIVAILDGDESNPYILNDYYETEVDDFTKGTAYYKLRNLEPGLHTLTFKAWDVYNNSSTEEITFIVAGDDNLEISKVLNYPNPFHNYTEFWFNHNRPYEPLEVQVQVFTVSGKLVWSHNQIINTEGFNSREISWNGKDDFGDAIGKGVYVYKLSVRSTITNQTAEKYEKLVIL